MNRVVYLHGLRSSSQGIKATALRGAVGARTVLINPALRPYIDLQPYRGRQVNMYSGETFEVGDAHFDELAQLKVTHITHSARYLLLETGDELLDYREVQARTAPECGAQREVQ